MSNHSPKNQWWLFRLLIRLTVLIIVTVVSGQTTGAQALNQILGGSTSNTAPSTASANTDPLGRGTPRGAIFGFLQSAQLGKNDIAAQYLQLTTAQRRSQGPAIASELLIVINRGFTGNLNRITDQPNGTEQIGVALGHEQVGMLGMGETEVPLDLIHTNDADGNKVWLISSETLSKLPELYEQTQIHQLENHLPPALVRFVILGMPAWQWLAMLALVPVALGAAWVLSWLALSLVAMIGRLRKQKPKPVLRSVSTPLLLVLATILHRIGVDYLVIPVLLRAFFGGFIGVIFIIAFAWLCSRILRNTMEAVENRAIASGR